MSLIDGGNYCKITITTKDGQEIILNTSGVTLEKQTNYEDVTSCGSSIVSKFKTSEEFTISGYLIPYCEPLTKKPSLLKRLLGKFI